MSIIKNRIDFVAFVSVKNANPNGDPLTGNMPRIDRRGHGEISPECIKRKIRNRFQAIGRQLCVVSNDKADDGMTSIEQRVTVACGKPDKDMAAYKTKICESFIDVRAFGGTFAWKGNKDKDANGVSIPVLGPVSIALAKSLDPIIINSMQITKSTNGAESETGKRGSDTMGMRHYVEFGLYRIEGSVNVRAAALSGLSDQDVEDLQTALCELFRDDESSARPSGSIEVIKVFWFEHSCANGNCTSAETFRNVKATRMHPDKTPDDVSDYEISAVAPAGVKLLELSGR